MTNSLSSVSSSTPLKKDEAIITIVDYNSSSESDDANIANPFLDPKVEEYYRGLYLKSNYECYEAFDPQFEYSAKEEKAIIKKLNLRVALAGCILFSGLEIQRSNLQNSLSDNFLNDLGLTTNDLNMGNTIFKTCFLLAEVPSQLISKALGPDIFIPIQMCLWSVVAMYQAALTGRDSFFITRGLIGLLEGGFIADLVLWLSYFFTSKELPVRLSWFWGTISIVQTGTAVLAFGILRMRGIAGMEGWRWLFLLEGIITLLISISGFYLMVPSAVETKNWMHPKGWFTEREEKIVVNRILRDDPSKGSMNNREGLTPKALWECLTDFNLWPLYLIGFTAYIGTGTVGSYFALTNRQLGFSTLNTNLLSIPHSFLHVIFLLGITHLSERVNERGFTCLLAPLYSLPLIAMIRWWSGSGVEVWPTWIITTLYLGQPYVHAICVSWVSRNANDVGSRSICSALYNMFVQLGGIVAVNIYREDDAPLYHRGNQQIFYLTLLLIPIFLFTKAFYVFKNHQKDQIWNAMSEKEKESYRKNSSDKGNTRLDFRFAH